MFVPDRPLPVSADSGLFLWNPRMEQAACMRYMGSGVGRGSFCGEATSGGEGGE